MPDRSNLIAAWLNEWATVNSGRYQVVRGFRPPEAHNFDKDAYLVLVTIASDQIVKRAENDKAMPFRTLSLRTRVLARIAPPAAAGNIEQLLSDSELDTMTDDLVTAIRNMHTKTHPTTGVKILGRFHPDDQFQEIYDDEAQLSGFDHVMTIDYR